MAVKASAYIYDFDLDESNQEFTPFLVISAGGTKHYNVNAGTFAANLASAVVNAALVAFIKAYAISDMGVTFGMLDTARLIMGVDLL